MSRRSDRAPGIEILDANPAGVTFRTDGAATTVTEAELDAKRFHIRRFGFAYIGGNACDEADFSEIANALLAAQEQQRVTGAAS